MLHAQKELMALPSLDVISKVVKIHQPGDQTTFCNDMEQYGFLSAKMTQRDLTEARLRLTMP
jgi:hypothetical protein